MNKKSLIILTFLLNFYNKTFADSDTGIFWSCVTKDNIKSWNIHLDDIPCVIQNAINFFMWIAWTISVIFIIIWAYQILFWSLSKDVSKGKTTIMYAIAWFILAASSWLIIKLILDNFS